MRYFAISSRTGSRLQRHGHHFLLVDGTSRKDASASRKPLRVASDTGVCGRSRCCCVGECSGAEAVLTVTAVTVKTASAPLHSPTQQHRDRPHTPVSEATRNGLRDALASLRDVPSTNKK